MHSPTAQSETGWQHDLYRGLKSAGLKHVVYVPDAGHSIAIAQAERDPDMRAQVLTTEEEGIGLLAGAWLGGERGVLLMQSSSVGNCVNTLSMIRVCGFPLLTLVTMRGEWGEFNPWQVPMGQNARAALELCGLAVHHV